ncbi:hypothetical protein SK128_024686 [Halocaridina rubra]|uniref:Uncharacterized protein n=1 Tax=Halocaridina rubra TaxID=373956 RepID=A0AAN8ZTW3_HALRR
MRPLRISRRIGGRKTLVGLISGAAVSLLILALLPHPVPNLRSQAIGLRRIHQEEDDYTAPKQGAIHGPDGIHSNAVIRSEAKVTNEQRGAARDSVIVKDQTQSSYSGKKGSTLSVLSHVLQLGMEAGGMSVLSPSRPHEPSDDEQWGLDLGSTCTQSWVNL